MKLRKAILGLVTGVVLTMSTAPATNAATYSGHVDGSFIVDKDVVASESPTVRVGTHTLRLKFKSTTEEANYFKIRPSKDCTVNLEAWGFSNDFKKIRTSAYKYQDEVSFSVFDSGLNAKRIKVKGKDYSTSSLRFYSKLGKQRGLAKYPFNKFETNGTLSFNAKAGKTYYLQVTPSGAWESDGNHGKVKIKISLK